VAAGATAGMPQFLNGNGPAPSPVPEPEQKAAGAVEEESDTEATDDLDEDDADALGRGAVEPVPEVSGVGIETQLSAYSVTLRGRTDASFSNSFRTTNVRTAPATGCDCAGGDCVSVTGTVESTFTVTTRVTLPSVNDFPDLTPCQRQRVRDGINNVLAPHERQHVAAFQAYNGTVRTPFDLTICRSDFNSRIQSLHDSVESARRSSAQAASDALDPFEFVVDLDCEDA